MVTQDNTARLRRRDVTWSLMVLALPIMGMTVSRMLMGFIDFAMVSQLGTTAQAAISPATTLIFVVSCLGMGIANGVQTFVSQADGFILLYHPSRRETFAALPEMSG